MRIPGSLAVRQFATSGTAVKVLVVNQLCFNVGFYMVLPFLAVYLSGDLGFPAWAVGLVLGVRVFSQQGLFIIGGSLSDRIGYRPVIIAGCILRTVGFLSFAIFSSLAGILVAAFLTGFAAALFSPAVDAYLALESEEHRADAFALFNVFGETGTLLGPLVGVMLLGVDFRVVCAAASVVFIVLAVVQIAYLPDREGGEASSDETIFAGWKYALTNGPFMAFALAMASYFILFNQMYLSLPFEIRRITGGETGIGVMFALSSILTVMFQMSTTTFLRNRYAPPRSISFGMTLMGMAFVPMMISNIVLPTGTSGVAGIVVAYVPIVLSTLLITAGMIVAKPFAMDAIFTLSGGRRLGTYYGLFYVVGGLAAAAGNSATGLLFDLSSRAGAEALPWILLLSLGIASAVAVTALERKVGMHRKESTVKQ